MSEHRNAAKGLRCWHFGRLHVIRRNYIAFGVRMRGWRVIWR